GRGRRPSLAPIRRLQATADFALPLLVPRHVQSRGINHLDERTPSRHADAAGEPLWRRRDLGNHEETIVVLRRAAPELLGDATERIERRRRSDEEDRRPADSHEWKAPLDRDGRLRERLRERETEA